MRLLNHRKRPTYNIRVKLFAKGLALAIAGLFTAFTHADNPIVSHVFTADPAARVFNDRMYIITSHDIDGAKGYETLTDYYLFSSDDMVNWRDHGVVFDVKKDSTWAKLAFAPDFIEKAGKYYLYYPDGADALGVAVADKPEGPYKDALGRALVNATTPGVKGVKWIFDPNVFIDDDGSAYLYFGGGGPGNLRVIRLNDDMISVSDEAKAIDAPHFFEAPYMVKRNGIYYLSYSTNGDNGSITIDYLTSNNPVTDFVHRGTVLGNPWDNRGDNNHHSMVNWKDQWYMFYHNRGIAEERGAGRYERSINVDLLFFNGDSLAKVKDSKSGVPPVKGLNPFLKIEAETIDHESGIETARAASQAMYVELDKGDWIQVSNLEFGSGATTFEAFLAANSATTLDLFLDHFGTAPIATINIPNTKGLSSWKSISAEIPKLSGVRKLYLRANGRLNIDWYRFLKTTSSKDTLSQDASKPEEQASALATNEKTGGPIGALQLLLLIVTLPLFTSLAIPRAPNDKATNQ